MTPSSLPIAQRSRHTGYLAIAQPAPGHGGIHIIILTEISLMPCPYRKWRSPFPWTLTIPSALVMILASLL
ncbi:MAG: hypothetical protein GDA43_05560 [Hormoscilla sp. SP5CHS1]|nr:hypothetical protein [Hormoscilla sp. SP5CHS1]